MGRHMVVAISSKSGPLFSDLLSQGVRETANKTSLKLRFHYLSNYVATDCRTFRTCRPLSVGSATHTVLHAADKDLHGRNVLQSVAN